MYLYSKGMILTKKLQVGFQACLYLAEIDRAGAEEMSYRLNIPLPFLNQVLNKLKKEGVIDSFRGPKGGYELRNEAVLQDVFDALQPVKMLEHDDYMDYRTSGAFEQRATLYLASSLQATVFKMLEKRIRDLVFDLKTSEINVKSYVETSTEYN